jgi:hypothetical protein
MRFPWLACLALLFVPNLCPAQCCWVAPVCVTYQMCPVTCYRAEWRAEKVPIVVPRVTYRKEVTPVEVMVWVPKAFDEKVQRTYYTPVPKVVERDVPGCTWVPIVWCDPCTGCPIVTYCPQMSVQRVQCIEYDFQRDDRVEAVRVWRCVQEPRKVDQVRWIPEVTNENTWTVRYTCVMVPYQSYMCVPVWMPPAR